MKKLISVLAITVFTFSFAQTYVDVSSSKTQLEKIYNGGQKKFDKDLQNNLEYTANAFQATGDFQLNFKVDENGKISDIELLPQLFNRSFEREVKRDVMRMKKHFANNRNENVTVVLNFSRQNRISDGREVFMTNDNFSSTSQTYCSNK